MKFPKMSRKTLRNTNVTRGADDPRFAVQKRGNIYSRLKKMAESQRKVDLL